MRRFIPIIAILLLAACQPDPDPALEPTLRAISLPTATVLTLPTFTPAPIASAAPTALPQPTQIAPPTEPPTSVIAPTEPPGITISETIGSPGRALTMRGSGFAPERDVTLHWGPVDGPLGPVALTVRADSSGAIEVELNVPPADQWPGGSAEEGEFIQLRAKSDYWADTQYYWANFRYVK